MCVAPGVQVVAQVPVLYHVQSYKHLRELCPAYLGPVPPPSIVVIPEAIDSCAC
jgi:hypothetical protein